MTANVVCILIGLVLGVSYCVLSVLVNKSLERKGKSFAQFVEKVRPKAEVTLKEDLETPSETFDRLLDEDAE